MGHLWLNDNSHAGWSGQSGRGGVLRKWLATRCVTWGCASSRVFFKLEKLSKKWSGDRSI